jgi:2-methylcitrate dehydratase PrpD
LAKGQSGPEAYQDQAVADPMVQSLADRVCITVNPERDLTYPSQRSSTVSLTARGRTFTQDVLVPRGDPENPFSRQELMDKFRGNAEKVLSSEQAETAAEKILNWEQQSLGQMVKALCP